jgi:hypothetical protein
MKQIRDKVAGLDVHRDTDVACWRVQQPDRSVDTAKQSFATTAKGLGDLVLPAPLSAHPAATLRAHGSATLRDDGGPRWGGRGFTTSPCPLGSRFARR